MDFPVIDMVQTGKNIKRLCRVRKISVRELQKYLHLTCIQTVYRWFEGRALPSIDNLLALSRLFGVPIEGIIAERFCTDEYGTIRDCSLFIAGDRRLVRYRQGLDKILSEKRRKEREEREIWG